MKKNFVSFIKKCQNKFSKVFITSVFTISILTYPVYAQENLSVLNTWLKYSDASNFLYHHFTDEAYWLLGNRAEKISQLTSTGQWKERQLKLRTYLWDILGPFPEKTPLNVKVTGKIQKDGYRIENLIYESIPGFYVTASLFLPDNLEKPTPAILFCSGHSTEAYRKQSYQLPLLNLVKKGFIVLAIDPIGQGERLQYFDTKMGKSIIEGSTKEHSYPSVQVSLIGQSIAKYFVWDGIRGIDYLVSRKEVDSAKIGVHGISGGGTQTAYISALDDRVNSSAIASYITSFSRLMESIGVQDGEQNLYHGIVNGIDHADLIEARAPKPTLIMATTNDFFSIQGVRETYAEVKRVYRIFGKPDNFQMVEDDHEHAYTQKTREAMYTFFQNHLMLPVSSEEKEVEYLTEQELQKTPTGQLSTSLGGETVFSLNQGEAEKYIGKLQESRDNMMQHLSQVRGSAMNISGYRKASSSDEPVFTGRVLKDKYVIEKYFVKGEGNYVLPYLLFIPDKCNKKAVIYLHPGGKAGMLKEENEIKWLMGNGFIVLAPDLLGIGELGGGTFKGDACIGNISYNIYYTAMLIGRCIVGVQAADVVKLSHLLIQKEEVKHVYSIAREEMSPVLLHAAVFDTVISRVTLVKPYSSYRSFVINRFYEPRFVYSLIPGALTAYDLPDLAASLTPRKLIIAGMTDAKGQTNMEEIEKDMEVIKSAYGYKNARDQLEVLSTDSIANPAILFRGWTIQ